MTIRALSSSIERLPVGGRWVIEVQTFDLNGYLTDASPTVVVTLPAGTVTTPTVERVDLGTYRTTYNTASSGRYVAQVVTAAEVLLLAAWATDATLGTGMPTAAEAAVYIGDSSYTEEEIQDALDAEAAAQRARCRVGAIYPDDLRQALLRRTMRNLAMRRLPLAVPQGDPEMTTPYLPGNDPEVRRLEAPHRKLVVG